MNSLKAHIITIEWTSIPILQMVKRWVGDVNPEADSPVCPYLLCRRAYRTQVCGMPGTILGTREIILEKRTSKELTTFQLLSSSHSW